jgi:hypothetical protein
MLAAKPRTLGVDIQRSGAFYGTSVLERHVILLETVDGTVYPMKFKTKNGQPWSDEFLRKPAGAITIVAVRYYVNGKLDCTLKFEKPYFYLPYGHTFKIWFNRGHTAMLHHSGYYWSKFRTYSLIPGSQNIARRQFSSRSTEADDTHHCKEWRNAVV